MRAQVQAKPGLRDLKPGLQNPKPVSGTYPPLPKMREAACGEIALPVWDSLGGPKAEPPRR
jgi:hypothetical protein